MYLVIRNHFLTALESRSSTTLCGPLPQAGLQWKSKLSISRNSQYTSLKGFPSKSVKECPYFTFSEGLSLFVECEDQEEVDEYWNKLVKAGATKMQCGWITDQFGLSWQIVLKRFIELIGDKNPAKVKAVMKL